MKHFEVHVYQTSIEDPPRHITTLQVYGRSDMTEDDAAKVAMQEAGGNMAVAKAQ